MDGENIIENRSPTSSMFGDLGVTVQDRDGHRSNDAYLSHLLPKTPSGVDRFLERHPDYDGRGIIVAVLDTGVDPGAAGLDGLTTDGVRKIRDVIDCTQVGDVDTRTIRTADPVHDENNRLVAYGMEGVSGRRLSIPCTFVDRNRDGTRFHVGAKRGYEFFPSGLVQRVTERRQKKFEQEHRKLLDVAVEKVAAAVFKDTKTGKASVSDTRDSKAELEQLLDLASKTLSSNNSERSWTEFPEDVGPIYDCLVFHDGSRWWAAVDREERGQLTMDDLMEDFDVQGTYRMIAGDVMLNFAIHIYLDGNRLSIVTDCGSHGTHVAGIVAAHFPDEPLLNGITPGAQIISCKIGDAHLGSQETLTSLTRALAYLMHQDASATCGDWASLGRIREDGGAFCCPRRARCDVVNLSYGEPSKYPEHGRFVEFARELVERYGVLFVSSAGNQGPCMSTCGAPGGTCDVVMGVGAFVTPQMVTSAYCMLDSFLEGSEMIASGSTTVAEANPICQPQEFASKYPEKDCGMNHLSGIYTPWPGASMPYTWSSRGPALDGACGVSFAAPGGAISCVPAWNLAKKKLMNGTSMASPHAAGVFALLLSAARSCAECRPYLPFSPFRLRRAVESSARPLSHGSDAISVGFGSADVVAAWDALRWHASDARNDLAYTITSIEPAHDGDRCAALDCGAGPHKVRGIYIRNATDTIKHRTFLVTIRVGPDSFFETELGKRALLGMELFFTLETTQPEWVHLTRRLVIHGRQGTFPVRIDSLGLSDNAFYTAEVRGYLCRSNSSPKASAQDTMRVAPASLVAFRVPITLIKPRQSTSGAIPRAVLIQSPTQHTWCVGDKGTTHEETAREDRWIFPTGHIHREFLPVPFGARYATIALFAGADFQGAKKMILQTVQLVQGRHFREWECRKIFSLRPRELFTHTIPVCGDSPANSRDESHSGVLEVCLAHMWSSPGHLSLHEMRVQFGGVVVAGCATDMNRTAASISLMAGDAISPPIDLVAHVTQSTVAPTARLTTVRRCLLPKRSEIFVSAGGDESRLELDQRNEPSIFAPPASARFGPCIFQLRFEFVIPIEEETIMATMRFIGLQGLIYEATVAGGCYARLVDSHGRLRAVMDAEPPTLKLRGEDAPYTLQATVTHDQYTVLDRLQWNTLLSVDLNLSNALVLPVVRRSTAAPEEKIESQILARGERACVYVLNLPSDDMFKSRPKWCKPTDRLLGEFVAETGVGGEWSKILLSIDVPSTQPSKSPPALSPPSLDLVSVASVETPEETSDNPRSGISRSLGSDAGDESSTNVRPTEKHQTLSLDQWLADQALRLCQERLRLFIASGDFIAFDHWFEDALTRISTATDNLGLWMDAVERLDRELVQQAPQRPTRPQPIGGQDADAADRVDDALVDRLRQSVMRVVSIVDPDRLSAYFGIRSASQTDEGSHVQNGTQAKRSQNEMDTRKTALIDALSCLARALDDGVELGNVMERLAQWVDTTAPQAVPSGDAAVDGNGCPATPHSEKTTVRRWFHQREAAYPLVVLQARVECYRSRPAIALRILRNALPRAGCPSARQAIALQIEHVLRDKLRWAVWAERTAMARRVACPDTVHIPAVCQGRARFTERDGVPR